MVPRGYVLFGNYCRFLRSEKNPELRKAKSGTILKDFLFTEIVSEIHELKVGHFFEFLEKYIKMVNFDFQVIQEPNNIF